MGGFHAPLLVALAALAAGCAAPTFAPESAPEAPEPAGAPAFSPPVVAVPACASTCFETSVAVDGAGRIYAAGGSTGPLGVSEDGGLTWRATDPPPAEGALQGDVLLQASPSGRLYYSAILVRTHPLGGFVLEGIQVAWTENGGETWPVNALLGPVSGPGHAAVVLSPDRQWLGFGEGETVYLTYNQIPTGIWAARSDDGGKTWGAWSRALALEARGGLGQSGPPAVGPDGRVFVAGCSIQDGGVVVAVSEDEGRSWSSSLAARNGCSWFPVPAVGPDGVLHVAYHDGAGGIFVVSGAGGGAGEAEPVQWGSGSPTSPWIVAGADGTLALAWYEEEGGVSALHFGRGSAPEGPLRKTVVVEGVEGPQGKRANTDFAHFVLGAQGRAVVVWSSMDDGEAMVAVETMAG